MHPVRRHSSHKTRHRSQRSTRQRGSFAPLAYGICRLKIFARGLKRRCRARQAGSRETRGSLGGGSFVAVRDSGNARGERVSGGYHSSVSRGCPVLDRWNISVSQPLNRRWSTSLPLAPVTILTVAAENTSAQLTEIENTIS